MGRVNKGKMEREEKWRGREGGNGEDTESRVRDKIHGTVRERLGGESGGGVAIPFYRFQRLYTRTLVYEDIFSYILDLS